MNTELAQELILILGEKRIVRVHKVLGSIPISFAMLLKVLYKRKMLTKLKSGKFKTVGVFAKKHGISKRTVYRALNKLYKK